MFLYFRGCAYFVIGCIIVTFGVHIRSMSEFSSTSLHIRPKLFAICGQPVLHSLSPQLFNAAFAASGINARYLRIRPSSAEQIVSIMRLWPLAGANITTPFKADIIPLLDNVDSSARCIGGVNTVVHTEAGLMGYNTDHIGVVRAVHEAKCDLSQSQCLVLGAGPAAAAAVYGLARQGARVAVANRTVAKAQHLVKRILGNIDVQNEIEILNISCLNMELPRFNVVVSALGAGVNVLDSSMLSSRHVLLDANYSRSALAQQALAQGCTVVSGRRWLLHQAVAAFEIMLGQTPCMERMDEGMAHPLHPDSVRIAPLNPNNALDADLLLADDVDFNTLVHEEMRCAFGG